MDWVIDTDVLVRAENLANGHDHWLNVFRLLSSMDSLNHLLAMDHSHKVMGEYRRNLSPNGWVGKLLAKFAKRGKVRYLSGELPNRIYAGLRSLGFDEDDDVFVAVATRTTNKLLVAEESDYSQPVVDFLLEHRVRVVDCVFASEEANRGSL